MVAFSQAFPDDKLVLDGVVVDSIHPDLTSGTNVTTARRLSENNGICFMGTTKVGDFDLDRDVARRMIQAPINPNGRPNSDVVRPWMNAKDFAGRPRGFFVIDFGTDMAQAQAALYELPFEYLRQHILPKRLENRREHTRVHGGCTENHALNFERR